MNILLARQGKSSGPFTLVQIEEMLSRGEAAPDDHVWHEGAPGWIKLADFMATRQSRPGLGLAHPASAPPPLGGDLAGDLERDVEAGGRYVIFTYCISIAILTFKRPSSVIHLRPGDDGAGQAFVNSLISLCVGWWGIPWGPIWTISTVINNARGGTDVTYDVLSAQIGPARASAVMARRRVTPPGTGMKLFRWGLVGIVAAPLVLVGLFVIAAVRGDSDLSADSGGSPGKAAFRAADNQIDHDSSTGNSTQARQVARRFADGLGTASKAMFESNRGGNYNAAGREFRTYCDLRDQQCIILVHVPELRRFKAEAKLVLCDLAWRAAQQALSASGAGNKDMKLIVGVRGFAIYDQVILGRFVDEPSRAGSGKEQSLDNSEGREALELAFASSEPVAPVRRPTNAAPSAVKP